MDYEPTLMRIKKEGNSYIFYVMDDAGTWNPKYDIILKGDFDLELQLHPIIRPYKESWLRSLTKKLIRKVKYGQTQLE
ncbi:unnamed protein product [marine sediment metagenome]|uniref:Uncharacterized protein n=1 Tax=marine sediment metagenome TaxID=412755 RepID=X0UKV4_9ZZZZ